MQVLFLFALFSLGLLSAATPASITATDTGITVSVTPKGLFSITTTEPAWTFNGEVGRSVTNLTRDSGADQIGTYQEITFTYVETGARQAGIRVYNRQPVVLFTLEYVEGGANTTTFPKLTQTPPDLANLSYAELFGVFKFNQYKSDCPWLMFDPSGRSYLLSPAANFMLASLKRNDQAEITSQITRNVPKLPDGFTHRTMLVLGPSIGETFRTWGRALTDLQGKKRPASDADIILKNLGYWTDAGATYYYNFEQSMGYAETLLAMQKEYAQKGVPVGYLQLDSWWYPKGPNADWKNGYGGIWRYEADKNLFPDGLKAFQDRLGLPLMTHSRWIDANSPLRQTYKMSDNVATDPLYWADVSRYLAESGVVSYEQDWLGAGAWTLDDLTSPDAYLGHMAQATAERGLTLQYCMPLSKHYLQTSKYNNVTTIRTSNDRFLRSRWDEFLYGSQVAGALGVWPFTDVFYSNELDHLLIANLSAGPVGVGDRMGKVVASNLRRAVRADGVIVKPDAPMTPLDQTILRDVHDLQHPMVAATYVQHGSSRAAYVFAYPRAADTALSVRLAELNITGPAFVYNPFTLDGKVVEADGTFQGAIQGTSEFWQVVGINPLSRIALLGDAQNFVARGKQRLPEIEEKETTRVTVQFAPGETSRTLTGYSKEPARATAVSGRVGAVRQHSLTQVFSVDVFPGADMKAVVDLVASAGRGSREHEPGRAR